MTLPSPDNTLVVIPVRMGASRLPGKPLADIGGEPMIVHVWKRARAARIGSVLVAAAEDAIAGAIAAAGGDAILTHPDLPSGSDRVAEAVRLRDPDRRFRFVVNLQGDLPTIESAAIARSLMPLREPQVDIATLAAPMATPEAIAEQSVVKVLAPLDREPDRAIARDFLRTLPARAEGPFWHHVGIYAFRREALERFVALPVSAREAERRLEQMRALDNGMTIGVARVDAAPVSVDTPDDLARVRAARLPLLQE